MTFGPRVLGKEEWEQQHRAHEEAERRGAAYGPRVVGLAPPAEQKPAVAKNEDAKSGDTSNEQSAESLSLAKLNDALQRELSDELLDSLLVAEFERSDGGPRKGALKLLLKAEQSRGEAARDAIIAELQGALTG
jgi:hypothetical protein